MKYIKTNWDIPYYNFALEDYLLNRAPEDDYVFFYIDKPSIIVGNFQNTLEEINQSFVDEKEIIVARRLSGGGAVYHDHGNLNFSFVHKAGKADINDFKKFTRPVIDALQSMNINASLSGRNDILVDDKKISGNAQCYKNGRIMHHGTLLYDADMSNLSKSLNVKELKIASKGIKSVRSRVANIKDFIPKPMTIEAFQDYLLEHFKKENQITEFKLTPEILEYIEERAALYASWDWNWGKSPTYTMDKTNKFACGLINVKLNVSKGTIKDLKIFGDFFTSEQLSDLEKALKGIAFHQQAIEQALAHIKVSDYFNGLSNQDFIQLLLQQ